MDLKAVEMELQHARLARIDAQEAGHEVDDLIRSVQHFQPGRQRLFFFIAGPDAMDEAAGRTLS